MFGFLKKKIANFSEKLKHNVTEKESKTISQKNIKQNQIEETRKKEIKDKKTKKVITPFVKKNEETIQKKQAKESKNISQEKSIKIINDEETKNMIIDEPVKTKKLEKTIKTTPTKQPIKTEEETEIIKETNLLQKKFVVKKVGEDKRELKANIGATSKIKSFFSKQIEISEKEIEELIFELELSLIESDVEQDTAKEITEQIQKRLIGKKVSSKNLNEYLKEIIKEILKEMMQTKQINLLDEIKNNSKPFKIILLGPNGAGKTTSIAKITFLLQKNGFDCVWAACDTFRSGAIDQLSEHAEKLGVKIIKQQYGADPAAVAFDAIKSAEANNNDVILIDTAGRQETNKNLMEELKKLERVVKPNLKIYVGEAYTGQGLLEMAKEFDEKIGVNAFILTKIDTDAKGGTTISLLYKLKKPILFVGTGQEYEDFEKFTPEFILNRII